MRHVVNESRTWATGSPHDRNKQCIRIESNRGYWTHSGHRIPASMTWFLSNYHYYVFLICWSIPKVTPIIFYSNFPNELPFRTDSTRKIPEGKQHVCFICRNFDRSGYQAEKEKKNKRLNAWLPPCSFFLSLALGSSKRR